MKVHQASMHICKYIYVCTYINIYVCMHVNIYVLMCKYVISMHACMYAYLRFLDLYIYIYAPKL